MTRTYEFPQSTGILQGLRNRQHLERPDLTDAWRELTVRTILHNLDHVPNRLFQFDILGAELAHHCPADEHHGVAEQLLTGIDLLGVGVHGVPEGFELAERVRSDAYIQSFATDLLAEGVEELQSGQRLLTL